MAPNTWTWRNERRASPTEMARLDLAAERFAARHDIGVTEHLSALQEVELAVVGDDRLARLWAAIVRRAEDR